MSTHSLLVDPESLRSNQAGHLTKEQERLARDRLGGLPGWLILVALFGMMVLAYKLLGSILETNGLVAIITLLVVILVTFAGVSFVSNLLGGLRLGRPTVEAVTGEVIWENSRYSAYVKSRRLVSITGSLELPPGGYTFYRLRGTNYLLSALSDVPSETPFAGAGQPGAAAPVTLEQLQRMVSQPLGFDPRADPERAIERLRELKETAQRVSENPPNGLDRQAAAGLMQSASARMKELAQGQDLLGLARLVQQADQPAPPELDAQGRQQLLRALEGSGLRRPSALEANLRGQQTAGQRFSLSRELISNLAWCGAVGLGGLVVDYILVVKKSDLMGALGVSAFFLLILAILLTSVRKELGDFLSGSVQVEEGWAGKYSKSSHSSRGNSIIHYYLQINENSFEISSVAYTALIEAKYRICYLPNTRQVVNIELL